MATTQEHRRARYMRKHAYKTARALARSVPSFAARQVDAATRERCARAIAEAAVDLTGAVFDALVRASPAPGPDAQESEAAEAQGRAPAKVSSLDIWRAPSLVNWCLLGGDSSEDPEEAARADAARDKAEADLDAAFAKTSAWLRAQLQAGRRGALDEAFDDHLGPVMLAHIRSGAMDTEPCANVRLALREVASQMQVNPGSLARGLAQPTEMATEREPDAPARRTKAETLRQIGDRLRQVNGDGPCNPPDLVLALDLLIDAHNETLRECETLRAAVAYRPGLPTAAQAMTDARGPDGMRPLRRPFHEGDDLQYAAEGAGTQFALGPVGACSRCGCHVRTPARISEDLWSVTLSRPSRRVMNELLLRVVGELRGLCWTCAGTREALQTARHLNREVQSDPSTSSEEAE